MAETSSLILENRGILRLSGEDRSAFLQGLISNDVTRADDGHAIYGALLTPQGRFLHDFFVVAVGDDLFIDCEADRRQDLLTRLSRYKLRSKVSLEDVTESWRVAVLFGPETAALLDGAAGDARPLETGGTLYVDPRLPEAGLRALLPADEAEAIVDGWETTPADWRDWDAHRLGLGLPDGSRDLEVEKALLMESGFDELHGIDWKKGCYMGQELTARTRYRGLVKKRLLPVAIDGPIPEPGTPILAGEAEAGEMRSAADGRGLALIRLERLSGDDALVAGGARLTVAMPDWVRLPQSE